MSTRDTEGPQPALSGSLHYLLKHALLRLSDLTGPALEPFGINGRECAVLTAIDERTPPSQQEVAERQAAEDEVILVFAQRTSRRQTLSDRIRNHPTVNGIGDILGPVDLTLV